MLSVNGNVVKVTIDESHLDLMDQAAHAADFSGFGGIYTFPLDAQAPSASAKKGAPWWLWGLGAAAAVGAVVVLKGEGETRKNPAATRLVDTIRPGDKVTIVTPQGQDRSGRAVMRGTYGWVLNMGGRHGTPGIATDENTVRVVHMKPKTRENPAKPHRAGSSKDYEISGHGFTSNSGNITLHRERIDLTSPGDYGADPMGDGTFRMVPSGDIVDWDERTRRLEARSTHRR